MHQSAFSIFQSHAGDYILYKYYGIRNTNDNLLNTNKKKIKQALLGRGFIIWKLQSELMLDGPWSCFKLAMCNHFLLHVAECGPNNYILRGLF